MAEEQPLGLSTSEQSPLIDASARADAAQAEGIPMAQQRRKSWVEQVLEEETRYMVAVDGSKQSGQAFRWVLREAVRFRDKSKVYVVIFNCLPECDFQVEISEDYQKAKAELEGCLQEYSKLLTQLGIPNEVKLVEGVNDVGEAICRRIKEDKIDTLVMGHTGKSGVKRLLLGSVSEHCVRNADCATVIVK